MMRRRKIGCVVLLFLLLLSACGGQGVEKSEGGHGSLKPRTFRAGEMEIVLDESFAQAPVQEYEACFTSEHVDVICLREEFTLAEGLESMTLPEYGKTVIDGNLGEEGATLSEKDGLTWFEYSVELGGVRFVYLNYLYKSDTSFWVVQFATPEEKLEPIHPLVEGWAKSVVFIKPNEL